MLDVAVLLDGYLVGILGYGFGGEVVGWSSGELVLTYTFAVPHPARLVRLLTLLGIQREVALQVSGPRLAAKIEGAEAVITTMFSRHPEVKTARGLMKLRERELRGGRYRLLYAAPLGDLTPEAAYARWCQEEAKWRSSRSVTR